MTVTFFMAAMPAMGMAAVRSEATLHEKGNGVYESPLSLETGGTWQVTVSGETWRPDDCQQTAQRERSREACDDLPNH